MPPVRRTRPCPSGRDLRLALRGRISGPLGGPGRRALVLFVARAGAPPAERRASRALGELLLVALLEPAPPPGEHDRADSRHEQQERSGLERDQELLEEQLA